jgi:hypothetical protein
MAAEPAGAEPGDDELGEDEVIQLSIDGDGDLTLTVGGAKPDEAVLTFGGGEIKLGKGQFKKGQRVAIMLVGPVVEVGNRDMYDRKTNTIAKVKRKHLMVPDTVRRIAVEQAEGPQLVQ